MDRKNSEAIERAQILNQFYTQSCDEEQRLGSRHGSIEFLTTVRYIEKYLEKGNKILEVGAGTGRYSLYYAKQGYDVTAIEYVRHNLDVLQSNVTEGMAIRAEQGDAVNLSRFADNSFDITLVLGPLYHLYTKEDQEKAIREAVRVTKPDGILAVADLSSDSIMVDWVLKDRQLIQGYKKDFDENFKIINYPGGVFAAFYIQEFLDWMSQFPVAFLHNVATDGMARHVREEIDQLDDEEFDLWLHYHFSTCERMEVQGYSNHLLYIGRKSRRPERP